jgi:hypothetical protein
VKREGRVGGITGLVWRGCNAIVGCGRKQGQHGQITGNPESYVGIQAGSIKTKNEVVKQHGRCIYQ